MLKGSSKYPIQLPHLVFEFLAIISARACFMSKVHKKQTNQQSPELELFGAWHYLKPGDLIKHAIINDSIHINHIS